jgi:hypothetical protein
MLSVIVAVCISGIKAGQNVQRSFSKSGTAISAAIKGTP